MTGKNKLNKKLTKILLSGSFLGIMAQVQGSVPGLNPRRNASLQQKVKSVLFPDCFINTREYNARLFAQGKIDEKFTPKTVEENETFLRNFLGRDEAIREYYNTVLRIFGWDGCEHKKHALNECHKALKNLNLFPVVGLSVLFDGVVKVGTENYYKMLFHGSTCPEKEYHLAFLNQILEDDEALKEYHKAVFKIFSDDFIALQECYEAWKELKLSTFFIGRRTFDVGYDEDLFGAIEELATLIGFQFQNTNNTKEWKSAVMEMTNQGLLDPFQSMEVNEFLDCLSELNFEGKRDTAITENSPEYYKKLPPVMDSKNFTDINRNRFSEARNLYHSNFLLSKDDENEDNEEKVLKRNFNAEEFEKTSQENERLRGMYENFNNIDLPNSKEIQLTNARLLSQLFTEINTELIETVKMIGIDLSQLTDDRLCTILQNTNCGDLEFRKVILKAFKKAGKINLKIDNEKTPLHLAAKWCDVELVKLLLEFGANVNAKDSEGLTPFQYCWQNAGNQAYHPNEYNEIYSLLKNAMEQERSHFD